MIRELETSKGVPALTSDRWHVVHSRWHAGGGKRPWARSVHSECDDEATCRRAARKLRLLLAREADGATPAEADQVFVCKPGFKSFKFAKTRRGKKK